MDASSALMPSQPPTPAALAPTQQAVPDTLQSRISDLKSKEQETQKKLSAINEATGGLQPPTLDNVPQMPQPKQENPVQVWGSAAMILAAAGSMLTRQPLNTALNSAASVMQSIRKGDMEQADAEYQRWKVSMENFTKLHQFQMDAYKAALSKASTDQKGALAEFTAYAKSFGDETAANVAETHKVQGAQKLMLDRENLALKMQTEAPKIEAAKAMQQGLKELEQNPEYQSADAMKKAGMKIDIIKKFDPKGGAGLMSDDDLKSMSEQYLAGDTSVLAGLGYGNQGAANRSRLQHMIRQVATEQGMSGADIAAKIAEFQGIKSGERTVGTRTANIELAAAELQKVLPLAKTASDNVPRGQFVPFNQAEQLAKKADSDPAIRKFVAATNTLINVYARAISPSGTPTVSDKEHARDMIDTAFDQKSYNAVLDQLTAEVKAAREAPASVREGFREAVAGKTKGASAPQPPKAGEVIDGWKFNGGDPSDKKNWTKSP